MHNHSLASRTKMKTDQQIQHKLCVLSSTKPPVLWRSHDHSAATSCDRASRSLLPGRHRLPSHTATDGHHHQTMNRRHVWCSYISISVSIWVHGSEVSAWGVLPIHLHVLPLIGCGCFLLCLFKSIISQLQLHSFWIAPLCFWFNCVCFWLRLMVTMHLNLKQRNEAKSTQTNAWEPRDSMETL